MIGVWEMNDFSCPPIINFDVDMPIKVQTRVSMLGSSVGSERGRRPTRKPYGDNRVVLFMRVT